MANWYHSNPRLVPSPQELIALPGNLLTQEIASVEAILANRYAPNGTFAELCDGLSIEGRSEQRAFWADITRYRANLYMAQSVQATESKNGGIGMLDVRTNDANPRPRGDCGWY